MNIKKECFGKAEGQDIELYTLSNTKGFLKVKVMTFGATITAVEIPDRNGERANVTLYLDNLEDYLVGHTYFGSTVGRYTNRISKGKFTLNNNEYQLTVNNGPNQNHGGFKAFSEVIWKAKEIKTPDSVGVQLSYESPDGEEGYPGTVLSTVTYSITDSNELNMEFKAQTDKPTHINLCNHAFWNLAGAGSPTIFDHELMLNADSYVPVDDTSIPTGEIKSVKNTPMDFTKLTKMGSKIKQVEGGYDHCYVLNKKEDKELSFAARVSEPKSGRIMEVFTTQPGIQFYTGNFLEGTLRTKQHVYDKNSALCLEASHFPDSPNHPQFPSTLLNPGEIYQEQTMHKFMLV